MKKIYQLNIIIILLTLIIFSGCVKQDFDKPPVAELPVGKIYNIEQLKQMYSDSGAFMIDYDASLFATVTMDESTGNLYKSAYVQDATDAVNLHKTASGGLSIGDSIRVYLKGVALNEYHGMFQLDNVDPDSNIVIIATEKYITPEMVTIPDILSGNYIGKLVKLENVQFTDTDLGKTWADANAPGNRTLEDCDDNQIIVRTSDYSTFAELKLPQGNGNLTAIAGVYDAKMQLYIRSLSEVVLTGDRCGDGGGPGIEPVNEINENFDNTEDYEDIAIDGWRNIAVAGNRLWQGKTYNNNKYAQATGYNSSLDDMETWLITPPVINTSGDKKLSFKSAMAYWSHTADALPLTVWASTDYDGTNFETAAWTNITDKVNVPTSNSDDNIWLETINVSLAEFTGNVTIAFKYKGSNDESTSMRVDDVKINTGDDGGGGDVLPNLNEDFESYAPYDPIDKDGWNDIIVSGDRAWIGKEFSGNTYAQATGYNSDLDDMETWMITPLVDNTAGNKILTFKSAMAHWTHNSGDPLEVYISTDYTGDNFETATWTKLNPTLPNSSGTNYEWVESGDVDLSTYTGNIAVAFKYKGSDTESTSIAIDDVKIDKGDGGDGGDVLPNLNEDFEDYAPYDPIDKDGWNDIIVAGDRTWIGKQYDDNTYAQATGYNSGLDDMETWMITPLVDNTAGDKTLTFKASQAYWAHDNNEPLDVYISTDFDGTNFESATWSKLDPILPTSSNDNYEWVESGNVSLSTYIGNIAIAFRYKGSNNQSTSIAIDDVVIE
jgi:hypothetical protein